MIIEEINLNNSSGNNNSKNYESQNSKDKRKHKFVIKNNIKYIQEKEIAYYKIQFHLNNEDGINETIKFFIDKPICFIGRSKYHDAEKYRYKLKIIGQTSNITLDASEFISRKHIKIWWNVENESWMISNLSKVRIIVVDKVLTQGESTKLFPITPISSLRFKFYFLLADQN